MVSIWERLPNLLGWWQWLSYFWSQQAEDFHAQQTTSGAKRSPSTFELDSLDQIIERNGYDHDTSEEERELVQCLAGLANDETMFDETETLE